VSMSIIEPGARLAGRYRVEDRVSESGGSTLWKAIDEILARPVSIRTFEADFPRAREAVTAARAASRLTDPRLTQVFDADDSGERAYVVSEWVAGQSLEDLLGNGPMEPERAAALVGEAAEAITAAHRAGLSHLGLVPRSLVWTTGGTVKVTGVAVEGALTGAATRTGEHDPAVIDAQGLGRLLYAAVTGHWPGDDASVGLPPAPFAGGAVCTPRELTAGVPPAIDSVVCRALALHLPGGDQAFTRPAEIAEALAHVPRVPLPLFMGMQTGPPPAVRQRPNRTSVMPAVSGTGGPAAPPPAPPRSPGRPPDGPGRAQHAARRNDSQINKPLVGLAALLAVVVVVVGGWQLSRLGEQEARSPASSAPPTTRAELSVASATGFDPQSGDGDEKTNKARLAFDSSSTTAWETDGYNSADFGKLKKGVGLLLDMGRPVRVSEVKVTVPGQPGAALQLRVGQTRSLSGLRAVARWPAATGTTTLRPSRAATGRYVLLWFTKLASDGGRFRGKISDVVIRGSAG
jgi:hypothetical protein